MHLNVFDITLIAEKYCLRANNSYIVATVHAEITKEEKLACLWCISKCDDYNACYSN